MEDTVPTPSGMNSGGEPVGHDTQLSIDSQIQQLMSSPHYLDGKTDPLEHRRLVEQVQQLYQRRTDYRVMNNETNLPGSERISDNSDSSGTLAVIKQGLLAEARAEMDLLVKMGFERAEITENIWPHEVEALKAQRLLNEGRYSEAGAILKTALDELAEAGISDTSTISSTKNLLDQFFAADYLDEKFKLELGEQLLTRIFHQQNDFRDELLSALRPDPNTNPKERIRQIQDLLTPSLRKANFRLYRQLLDEQTRLYQCINPGFLK